MFMAEWDVYLGEYDAATNLALDEFMLEKASDEGEKSIRFYEFENPAVILARSEHPDDILEWRDGIDYTRRDSGGSVIYCDDNALYYSIVVPAETDDFPESLHRDYFGPKIAEALSEAGVPDTSLGVGEHFSVRIDGKTVSGNSQRKKKDAILYHGVLAYEPWDVELLDDLIDLRERNCETEKEFIDSLPGVSEYSSSTKNEIRDYMIQAFTEGDYKIADLSVRDKNKIDNLKEKYVDEDWIKGVNEPSLKRNQGFCFVDWTDEWNEEIDKFGFY